MTVWDMTALLDKNAHARRLFDAIADSYEGPAEALSLFQYGRWRRYLISRLELSPGSMVLDVCTGTGLVARDIAAGSGSSVLGIDLSRDMVDRASSNLKAQGPRTVGLAVGQAESLPFADGSFDVVVFTFLLRYVEDPQATLAELSRVLRPGGQMASLEFFVPRNPVLRAFWLLHTRLAIPASTRFLSPGWREVGSLLGPSISSFYRRHTVEELDRMWQNAGVTDVKRKALSLGGALVTWGRKEADI